MHTKTALLQSKILSHFCAADMASAIFGEARDKLFIYMIASFVNEENATGKRFPIHDVDIDLVRRSVPKDRAPFLAKAADDVEPGSDPALYQPVLLVEDRTSESGHRMIDGLIRLNAQIRQGRTKVRCFIISSELAEEKGRTPLGDLWEQDTLAETTPPAEAPKIPAINDTAPKVGSPVISTAHAHARQTNASGLHPDAISLVPMAITAATTDENTKRPVAAFDTLIPSPMGRHRFKSEDQKNLDVELRWDVTLIRRKARAAMSYPQLVLIYFLLTLFRFIRSQSPNETSNRAGHTIVSDDPRFIEMVDAPKNLAEKLKGWNKLRPGANEVWSKPVHVGLAELGMKWRARHGVPAPESRRDHGFELIDAAFKAQELANTLRATLRKVHKINNKPAPDHIDWRAILQLMADGNAYKATRADHDVLKPTRALLALHGRFNPAKIWRDTTRDTLLYQWLIAIGDLVRGKRMVVTCLMAQELFIVDDIRSVSGQANAIAPEWDLFDEALALAAGDPDRLVVLRRDLILRCVEAMQGKCALVLTLPEAHTAPFNCQRLSPQESIYADTLTLLT